MNLQFDKFLQQGDAPTRCHIRHGVPADAQALSVLAARTFIDTYGEHNHPDNLRMHLDSSFGTPQQARELSDPDVATLLASIGR